MWVRLYDFIIDRRYRDADVRKIILDHHYDMPPMSTGSWVLKKNLYLTLVLGNNPDDAMDEYGQMRIIINGHAQYRDQYSDTWNDWNDTENDTGQDWIYRSGRYTMFNLQEYPEREGLRFVSLALFESNRDETIHEAPYYNFDPGTYNLEDYANNIWLEILCGPEDNLWDLEEFKMTLLNDINQRIAPDETLPVSFPLPLKILEEYLERLYTSLGM